AAVLCAGAALASSVLLIAVHADGVTAAETARTIVPAGLVDAVLALPVVALVGRALRSDALAAPRPLSDLVTFSRRV
ncbi:MAG TPA: hypothetical protein VKQ07_03820, partial [Jatrophihabitantaceae bacterium]|nr:hypothetical protein [Jatrophihabitantaceae bacterium]